MRDFRKLKVWEKAHLVTLLIYRSTAAFPKEEQYGLTSQIRRAAASIPANIAEGCGRNGPAELSRFLSISLGSASELEYHLYLAQDLGYLSPADYTTLNPLVLEVKQMLTGLLQRLKADN